MTNEEMSAMDEALAALPLLEQHIRAGRFIYCFEGRPSQSWACWEWLYTFITLIYGLIKGNKVRKLRILAVYDDRNDGV